MPQITLLELLPQCGNEQRTCWHTLLSMLHGIVWQIVGCGCLPVQLHGNKSNIAGGGEERSAAAPQKSSSRCLQKLGFRFIFHRLFCVEAKNVPQMLLRIIQVFTYADMLHLIMLNNINIKKVVYYVIFGVYYFIKLRLCLKICV